VYRAVDFGPSENLDEAKANLGLFWQTIKGKTRHFYFYFPELP
jgi:hypothetical protein